MKKIRISKAEDASNFAIACQTKIDNMEYRLQYLRKVLKSPKTSMCKVDVDVVYKKGFNTPQIGHIIEFDVKKAFPMIKTEIELLKGQIREEKKIYKERLKKDKYLQRYVEIERIHEEFKNWDKD